MSENLRRKIIRRDRARGCYFGYEGCTGYTGQIEVHHLIEDADGGGNEPENLVAACKSCHTRYSAQQSSKRAWDWKRRPEAHPGVLRDDEL